jgi:hypothetical protein
MLDISVFTPCFYPTPAPVWRLIQSAEALGIPLIPYGLGEQNRGWIYSHLSRLKSELEETRTTYFLFTDAIDCFFMRGLPSIIRAYKDLGSPDILASSESNGLNAGGFIGRCVPMISMLRRLLVEEFSASGDPQERWRRAFEVTGDIQLDSDSTIFQTTSGEIRLMTKPDGVGIYNLATGSSPCILHSNGGYTDPLTFKSDRMDSWWKIAGMERLCQKSQL